MINSKDKKVLFKYNALKIVKIHPKEYGELDNFITSHQYVKLVFGKESLVTWEATC